MKSEILRRQQEARKEGPEELLKELKSVNTELQSLRKKVETLTNEQR